jgi:hypothetical protein
MLSQAVSILLISSISLGVIDMDFSVKLHIKGYSTFTLESNYNTYDAEFDKVQLLLHFNDASGTKQVNDVKGHYPIGLKQAAVKRGAFGTKRESVIILDGADWGGIEISPNNSFNAPSSFNLFQDVDGISRTADVDWCFECFISDTVQTGSAWTTGGYIASNSHYPNIENDYNTGVDWGVRLELGKVIVVIGDMDYAFDIPVGYPFLDWNFIRVQRESDTLTCWLNTDFLGFHENVAVQEKRYHSYFKIGRANKKKSLRTALDEVRFTIGSARTYDNGTIPRKPFPNIGDLEKRPKIVIGASAYFADQNQVPAPTTQSISTNIPVSVDFDIAIALTQSEINIDVPAPSIAIAIQKTVFISAHFEIYNPINFLINISSNGAFSTITIPSPTLSISISHDTTLGIAMTLPSLVMDLAIKEADVIDIGVVIPDPSTPITTPSVMTMQPMTIPVLPLVIDIAIEQVISILATLPAPSITISAYTTSLEWEIQIASVPSFNIEITPPFDLIITVPSPSIELYLPNPTIPLPNTSEWFNELLIDFTNSLYTEIQNVVDIIVPVPKITLGMSVNQDISTAIKLPKLQITTAISPDNHMKKGISMEIYLPPLKIDAFTNRELSMSLDIKPLSINIELLTSDNFL